MSLERLYYIPDTSFYTQYMQNIGRIFFRQKLNGEHRQTQYIVTKFSHNVHFIKITDGICERVGESQLSLKEKEADTTKGIVACPLIYSVRRNNTLGMNKNDSHQCLNGLLLVGKRKLKAIYVDLSAFAICFQLSSSFVLTLLPLARALPPPLLYSSFHRPLILAYHTK